MMQPVLLDVLFFLLLCQNINADTRYRKSKESVGAVYTMSNGATMNQILIQRIDGYGTLTAVSRVNTNGTGVNNTAFTILQSQGSLTAYSNYLFAVNPGSNSLSLFWINPRDATQLKLISVQPTFGQFPISVAVNYKYACVLTGGVITGIRCFTYDSHGLHVVPSFDRNLTSYISQVAPPPGPENTMSDIIFSADNHALIIAVKGVDQTKPGYLLFFLLNDECTKLSSTAIKMIPRGAIWPFSLTLVGRNGLLLSDEGSNGVLTLTYSSRSGMISNSVYTFTNTSFATALCWSVYSPTIGNYYVIGGGGTIIELNLNLDSHRNPVRIVQYFDVSSFTGASDGVVVTLGDTDYLYVISAVGFVMYGYRLNAPGHATLSSSVILQQGDTSNLPQLTGIAAFLQSGHRANDDLAAERSVF